MFVRPGSESTVGPSAPTERASEQRLSVDGPTERPRDGTPGVKREGGFQGRTDVCLPTAPSSPPPPPRRKQGRWRSKRGGDDAAATAARRSGRGGSAVLSGKPKRRWRSVARSLAGLLAHLWTEPLRIVRTVMLHVAASLPASLPRCPCGERRASEKGREQYGEIAVK